MSDNEFDVYDYDDVEESRSGSDDGSTLSEYEDEDNDETRNNSG